MTSSNLKQMNVKDYKIHYQMKITYEAITQEDYKNPVVLVVEWRDTQGDDKREHIFLEDLVSASQGISELIGGPRNSDCKVDGKKMFDGEVREDTTHCIVIRCDVGDIVIEKLDSCVDHDEENDMILFPDDLRYYIPKVYVEQG